MKTDELLPGYRVLRELSSGFGRSYKAVHVSSDRAVRVRVFGVKGLSPERWSRVDEALQESCTRARAVSVPGVVQVHELGHAPGQEWVLATDLVEAMSIADLKQSKGRSFTADDVAFVGMRLAQMVEGLHECGVSHGSLMPGWVLVDRKGDVHLDGLGLAPVLSRDLIEPSASASVGRAEMDWYRLQPHEDDEPDDARDWFQIGVVLTVSLTGKLPLGGKGTSVIRGNEFQNWMRGQGRD